MGRPSPTTTTTTMTTTTTTTTTTTSENRGSRTNHRTDERTHDTRRTKLKRRKTGCETEAKVEGGFRESFGIPTLPPLARHLPSSNCGQIPLRPRPRGRSTEDDRFYSRAAKCVRIANGRARGSADENTRRGLQNRDGRTRRGREFHRVIL